MENTIYIETYKNIDKSNLIDLIDDLQDYLASIDPLKKLRRLDGYGNNYVKNLLNKVKTLNGVIFVAKLDSNVVGIITGIIEKQTSDDLLEWVPSTTGRVLDLIVSEDSRNNGIGLKLMNRMEDYFKEKGCDIIRIRVMNANTLAHQFYKKNGYDDRVTDVIKSL